MESAPRLLQKLSQKLFPEPVDQAQFIAALTEPPPFAPCILWLAQPSDHPFAVEPPLDWQPAFVDRLAMGSKPGQHKYHQQGKFYCLDFSSVFAASVLLTIKNRADQTNQPIQTVLDVCAAPGGKSIFAWKALQPQLLLSNEVIGKRMGALISNLKRCQIQPGAAFSLDSSLLATELAQTADVVLVDAPCTGQSLLAKGEKNPGCFHPVNINKNASRQKRILANSAQTVLPQGFLVYMTCAYSPEENEQVIEWLLQRFPQFRPIAVLELAAYQSHLTELPCYRMFPQSQLGAGAFTILLQNTEPSGESDAAVRVARFLERPHLVRLGVEE